MPKSRRNFPRSTRRVLDIQSLNQCAYPECTNTLVEPGTEKSGPVVTGHICHIRAINPGGPRWKEGLAKEELNSADNLVLLCRHHHGIVDLQPEVYTADILRRWKCQHENKVKRQHPDAHGIITKLVDQKINDEIDRLCKSRFFKEFDNVQSSFTLAKNLVEGELSVGTDGVRSQALAWCVRLLSRTERLPEAEKFLQYAKDLGSCQEIDIAQAFLISQKDGKNAALKFLDINSPISRTAAFMIVSHHEGPQAAVNWLETAGLNASDLGSEGKFSLLMNQINLAGWAAAKKILSTLTDDDLHDTPFLYRLVAMTHLIGTVPGELCPVVLEGIPLSASEFPLASTADAICDRRIAQRYFVKAVKVEQELGCHDTTTIDEGYALWLELMDPDESERGRERLKSKLNDLKTGLHFVRLGVEFNIKVEPDAVEQEIQRQIAISGGITSNAAHARFALAFVQPTPGEAANYISRYRQEISKHIGQKTVLSVQIELYSKAGLHEKAYESLKLLLQEDLSEIEESRLRSIIERAEGADTADTQREQFRQTNSLMDLMVLVGELVDKEDWESLCEYGKILFERTHKLGDGERFAIALFNTQKSEQLKKFLEANETLLAQSKQLQLLRCWTLYDEGSLLVARSEMSKLGANWDEPNYRALRLNLAISMGNWDSLSAMVANECTAKSRRSAQELIKTAQLAFHLDLPQGRELLFTAAEKAESDANVLGAAYLLASMKGLEDRAEVTEWLSKAASLSGEDGPFQRITLRNLLDQKPEWERKESEILDMVNQGGIPMFLAAQSLNKTLIGLMLLPALDNLSKKDPRGRSLVPAYSGNRQPTLINFGGQIGMDVTALLTLGFLKLLDDALDAFDTVYISHSTLSWLFEEKQRASFHQPSRIKDAHEVSRLLTNGTIERLLPVTVADSDLSDLVGDELSQLIGEAGNTSTEDDRQRLVVQSSPVYRVASLMEQEADLTAHETVLSSCQSIIEKLLRMGRITFTEAEKAQTYLQLHEKPWPNQPKIADGAVLYLDNLAVGHFLHLGMLEKLKTSGFRLIVSPSVESEIDQLLSYESISDEVLNFIEQIRSAVASRIESGTIKVDSRINSNQHGEQPVPEHPTFGISILAKNCDAIIADDRFLNQHATIGDGDPSRPIFTSLDLIDALVSVGCKTFMERLEYRTLLRRAGYFFIPVSGDELTHHLNASTVEDDKVIETAELKAIRESLLCVRMRNCLRRPKEAPWLVELQRIFIEVLKYLWKADANFSDVRARSNWLMDQIDLRGWAHIYDTEAGDYMVKTGRGAYTLLVLMPPHSESQIVRDEYWSWVEERVLTPIKEQYSSLYLELVEWHKNWIADVVNVNLAEGGQIDE